MTLPATYYAVTQRLCALNNHGVKSLQAGGIQRAEEYFAEAIDLAKELISSTAQHLDESDYCYSCKQCCCSCKACQILPSVHAEEVQNPIYIYSRPLLLPTAPCRIPNLETTCLYCAAILFNMGLMNHLLGLQTTTNLTRAEAFYERSILLLNGTPRLVAHRYEHETAILLLTAIGNNLAQIALENGDINVVRDRLRSLDGILRGPNGNISGVLQPVEWTGILSNVLLGDGLNTARAA